MTAYEANDLIINGLMSFGTLLLAFLAFREIRQGERVRAADTLAVRYLLIGEIHRLTLPYRRVLLRWTGEGQFTYPAGTVWESTSEAWTTALARLPQLTPAEQTQLSRLNIRFTELAPEWPQSNRFESEQKVRMRETLAEADAAVELLAQHLPAAATLQVRRLQPAARAV